MNQIFFTLCLLIWGLCAHGASAEDDLIKFLKSRRTKEEVLKVSAARIEAALTILAINNTESIKAQEGKDYLRALIERDGVYDGFIIPGLMQLQEKLKEGDLMGSHTITAVIGTLDPKMGNYLADNFNLSRNVSDLQGRLLDSIPQFQGFEEADFMDSQMGAFDEQRGAHFNLSEFLNNRADFNPDLSLFMDTSASHGGGGHSGKGPNGIYDVSRDFKHFPNVAKACFAGCGKRSGEYKIPGVIIGGIIGGVSSKSLLGVGIGAGIGHTAGDGLGCVSGCIQGMEAHYDYLETIENEQTEANTSIELGEEEEGLADEIGAEVKKLKEGLAWVAKLKEKREEKEKAKAKESRSQIPGAKPGTAGDTNADNDGEKDKDEGKDPDFVAGGSEALSTNRDEDGPSKRYRPTSKRELLRALQPMLVMFKLRKAILELDKKIHGESIAQAFGMTKDELARYYLINQGPSFENPQDRVNYFSELSEEQKRKMRGSRKKEREHDPLLIPLIKFTPQEAYSVNGSGF